MKLFAWLKNDPVSKGLVPGRAVAIPHYPKVESRSNYIENSSSADSVSTLSVTLRLLQPGETAVEVGSRYERLLPNRMHSTTNLPDGCQRMHCNCPNWVHLMVRQEGYVHKEHTEVPVWVNPTSGKIDRIDKDKLIAELEPEKARAKRIFQEAGMLGKVEGMDYGSSDDSPLDVGGAIGNLFGVVSTPTSDPSGDPMKPDMSKYPPIEGVDMHKWIEISVALVKQRVAPAAYDSFAQSCGAPAGKWGEIDRAWNQRVNSDWKLGALFGSEYEATMKKR